MYADCVDIDGNYVCRCNNGYNGDGLSCAGEIHNVRSHTFQLAKEHLRKILKGE